jgi:hypothetical protein
MASSSEAQERNDTLSELMTWVVGIIGALTLLHALLAPKEQATAQKAPAAQAAPAPAREAAQPKRREQARHISPTDPTSVFSRAARAQRERGVIPGQVRISYR